MKKEDPIPYDGFSTFTQDFVNEMQFRSMSAMGAVRTFELYRKKSIKDIDGQREYRGISDMAYRFAISEISTLIDGSGKLSMKVSKNNYGEYKLDKNRLKKLLVSLPENEFSRISDKLARLIEDNHVLVNRILHTRHNRLAHAGISSHKPDPISITGEDFPNKEIYKFIDRFESIAYQIIFGIELT